jgi:hypothetical protein
MNNKKLIMIAGVLALGMFLTGCGTMGQQTGGGAAAVQVSSAPSASGIVYLDYPTPMNDFLKSVNQFTVPAGSVVKIYNNASLSSGSLVGQQTADIWGMFIISLGDNVVANNTVYLTVTESGKQPSPAIAFTR